VNKKFFGRDDGGSPVDHPYERISTQRLVMSTFVQKNSSRAQSWVRCQFWKKRRGGAGKISKENSAKIGDVKTAMLNRKHLELRY